MVPVLADGFTFSRRLFATPRPYSWRQTKPSRATSTTSRRESAFTTETPTPCSPPATAYDFVSNFPPECRVVRTTSTAGFRSRRPGMGVIGMPRPLSATRHPPSASSWTTILLQDPASASSIELSTTSYTR